MVRRVPMSSSSRTLTPGMQQTLARSRSSARTSTSSLARPLAPRSRMLLRAATVPRSWITQLTSSLTTVRRSLTWARRSRSARPPTMTSLSSARFRSMPIPRMAREATQVRFRSRMMLLTCRMRVVSSSVLPVCKHLTGSFYCNFQESYFNVS